MNKLYFSDHVTKLRREKKVTQEQLADFLGVTKAAVSKWETGQSLPDVSLLPQLAAYFDVTIDTLLGYESQLSKEQIQKTYFELATDFADKPFEEVMEKSNSYVKQYYSCYPFLFQMVCLWLNHFMLAEGQERQMQILENASDLCQHISKECKDIGICSDVLLVDASIKLQLGKPHEVVEMLEEVQNPCRLSRQGVSVLIQAYQMIGDIQRANDFTQISMYLSILELISCATQYITIHMTEPACCEETICRVEAVIRTYHMESLHPNVVMLFHYHAAIMYAMNGNENRALEMIERYVRSIDTITDENCFELHGDEYFDRLDVWIDKLDLGAGAPRDRKVIFESAMSIFTHPAFASLETNEKFQELKIELTKRGEILWET